MKVKEILKEKGITAKELASIVGMSEVGISVALSDKGNPSLKTLEKIANVLGVEMYELFESNKSVETLCPHCGKPIKLEKGE